VVASGDAKGMRREFFASVRAEQGFPEPVWPYQQNAFLFSISTPAVAGWPACGGFFLVAGSVLDALVMI